MNYQINIHPNGMTSDLHNRRMMLKKAANTSEEGHDVFMVSFKRLLKLDEAGKDPEGFIPSPSCYIIKRPHSVYAILISKTVLSSMALDILSLMNRKKDELIRDESLLIH